MRSTNRNPVWSFTKAPSGQLLPCRKPGVETPGFYEADYVKSRVKHFFSLSLVSFIPKFGNNSLPWLRCLIVAAACTPQ